MIPLEVINHAKFQLDRFRGFAAQVDENRYLPFTRGIALTTVYALTCYTVIYSTYNVMTDEPQSFTFDTF